MTNFAEYKFLRPFSIDLRTLALFRICLALVTLANLLLLSRDLDAFFTDKGILPRSIALPEFSLHMTSGTLPVQIIIFTIHACFALSLLVGYRTRIATLVLFFFALSLPNRNPLIFHKADTLLSLLFFWSIFLPLGARYSFDAIQTKIKTTNNRYFSAATIAILIQVASIYFFGALLKSSSEWIPNGEAVYMTLNSSYATSLGIWLGQFKELTRFLTYYVWYLELLAPVFVFLPVFYPLTRIITLFLLITLHIAFLLFLNIGEFPFISITALLVFIPTEFWDWLNKSSSPTNETMHEQSSFSTIIVSTFIIIMCWGNISSLPNLNVFFPSNLQEVLKIFRINQDWLLFAPRIKPPYWYVTYGTTIDGRTVDPAHNLKTAPDEKRPRSDIQFKNYRWRRITEALAKNENLDKRKYMALYLCKKWNDNHYGDKILTSISLYYFIQKDNGLAKKYSWGKYECAD